MTRIENIEKQIEPLREKLRTHRLYDVLAAPYDIRIFMQQHIYAVWDFMSLLKALQKHLTCTTLPWKPAPNPKLARFINEIVHGEESDINEKGEPKSHFNMYLEAMHETGADTQPITDLLAGIKDLSNVNAQIDQAEMPAATKDFLHFTFNLIKTDEPHKIAAAFTFGREDLIPDMFLGIINRAYKESNQNFPKLTYYFERHIEVDGDEHGPLSLEMIEELCGNDNVKWKDALTVAQEALQRRIALWDAVAEEIAKQKAGREAQAEVATA